jgi:hypothetical protein
MRGLPTLVAFLLLLAPLGVVGQGEDPSSSSSSTTMPEAPGSPPDNSTGNSTGNGATSSPRGPPGDGCPLPRERPDNQTEIDACTQRYCRENPGDQRRCEAEEPESGPRPPAGWEAWCRDEARDDSQRDRCRQALAEFEGERDGRWISFRVDAANVTLLDYRIAGGLVLESIHLETGSENLTVQRSGSALRIGDGDSELVLHDNPTGLVRFKGDDGSITVVLAAGSRVDRSEDGLVARIQLPDGRVAHLRSDNATWLDARTVLMTGFGAILVPAAERPQEGPAQDAEEQDRGEKVKAAIEERRIGAEITLHSPRGLAAAASDDGNGSVEVLAYDDVEVKVQMPAAAVATPEAPIRIEVSAELEHGRTIVLNLNRSLLDSARPDSLVLRYFDLHEQADGSVLETEVVLRMASSLQDVLEAGDDSGQPEFWVVEDANGLQALVSVPHWSTHIITVGSLAQLSSPNVVAGLAIGVAASLLAAGVMFWPRRPEDD